MTQVRVAVRYPLATVQGSPRLSLDSFAARAGVHPELVRRFVALGLLPAAPDAAGQLWFVPADLPRVARIRRLHADLALNYAALGLVLELLERIHQLERAAARAAGRHRPWT
jgi:DNA-binding transcriptional MerR regulator